MKTDIANTVLDYFTDAPLEQAEQMLKIVTRVIQRRQPSDQPAVVRRPRKAKTVAFNSQEVGEAS